MPAPIAFAPIAWKAAQLGAVAALTYYATRRQRAPGPRDVWRETALNDLDIGLETDFAREQNDARAAAAGKWRRGWRIGAEGPGVEMEIAGLARIRLRRL
ncbi:MAG: hypothetical protein ACPGGK_06420 [Pikeienuella sp.]